MKQSEEVMSNGDGGSIEEYARMTAPSYYEDEDQREDGPEACASAQYSGESHDHHTRH